MPDALTTEFLTFINTYTDMEISHIEHIGIAVPSLDEAIPFYENMLGLKCFAIEEVADQKVRTAFFQVGQTKIELLEGTADDSAISKFIANNGGRGGEPKASTSLSYTPNRRWAPSLNFVRIQKRNKQIPNAWRHPSGQRPRGAASAV